MRVPIYKRCLLAPDSCLLISITQWAREHETSDSGDSGRDKRQPFDPEKLVGGRGEGRDGRVRGGCVWLPLQIENRKWITLVTLSGSDKANDLLSSQMESLICLLDEIKDNDGDSFQTLLFNSKAFMPLGRAGKWKAEYDRGLNASRDLTIKWHLWHSPNCF